MDLLPVLLLTGAAFVGVAVLVDRWSGRATLMGRHDGLIAQELHPAHRHGEPPEDDEVRWRWDGEPMPGPATDPEGRRDDASP